ncbi:hypothetical protein M5E87_13710 [Flavonifractor plautii]|nr:hypothetical protein M5E87_13710 [Flavonifractor plautii]
MTAGACPWAGRGSAGGALLRSELRRMPAGRVGRWESVTGVRPAYAADAAKRSQVTQAPLRRLEVAVPGREPADRALAEALERLGCTVRREASPACPPSVPGGAASGCWPRMRRGTPPAGAVAHHRGPHRI